MWVWLLSGLTETNSIKIFEGVNSHRQLPPRKGVPTYTLPTVCESPHIPTNYNSGHFILLSFLNLKGEKNLFLICLFFIASKSGPFSYLLAVCISSLMNWTFTSFLESSYPYCCFIGLFLHRERAAFSTGVANIFPWLSCSSLLCILWVFASSTISWQNMKYGRLYT